MKLAIRAFLAPPEKKSARLAIDRLKRVIKERIERLEAFGVEEGEEKIAKAANGLIVALEKVLELEEQQRRRREQQRARVRRIDDAWRDELARRIANAGSLEVAPDLLEAGSATAADGLATLGEAGSTSA